MNLKNCITLFLFLASPFYLWAQLNNFSTHLPVVHIHTNGQEIRDEPKILVDMGIIWDSEGNLNETSGEYNHYNGKIGIEIRGSSSQMFPKKSFGFETRDENGMDIDFPLLGLPEEEDWILYAPYSDKTLIRNVLTFTLAAQLGHYVPRCRFVELFINDEYWGVYVLMEKIKRDDNRLDIATLRPDDTEGEELTGGYIVKIDKTTGSGGSGWYSDFQNAAGRTTFYQFEEPESDEIKEEQSEYIQNYFHNFETAIYNKEFDSETGYQQYADISTFIDYFIMNELSKNVDGYRLSTFFFKDKNERINMGPIWDFNLAYGNANYHEAWEVTGIQALAEIGDDQWQNPFWWKILLSDKNFTKELRCRWNSLHEDVFSTERIMSVVDSLATLLDEPKDRNFQRWPVLGEYVWPNYFVGDDYASEVTWMKNWLYARIRAIHLAIPGDCDYEPVEPVEFAVNTYPNPFNDLFTVQVMADYNYLMKIELFSVNGTKMFTKDLTVAKGNNQIEINTSGMPSGFYIYRVFKGNESVAAGKIIKR